MEFPSLASEHDLDQVLDRHDTVVLDFWAGWCHPCKAFLPILEQAAGQHPEIAFFRVNTAEVKDLTQAFDVESIPTLVVIRDRIMVASQPGVLSREVLEDLIQKVKALDMEAVRRGMEKSERP
jgi:thioredoxin 1